MKKEGIVLLSLFLVLLSGLALGEEKTCLYFFYGEEDVNSKEIGTYLEELKIKYPTLELHKFEIYYNKDNAKLLGDYFKANEVAEKERGVPTVFLEKVYFVGSKPIKEFLINNIEKGKGGECPSLEGGKEGVGVVGEKGPLTLMKTLSFFSVSGAAIKDGFNPGALAVLLVLLILLLLIAKKERVLWSGISFLVGVYGAYFLFGRGSLEIIMRSSLFNQIIGWLVLGLGLVTLIYYLWKREAFLEAVRENKKVKGVMRIITNPLIYLGLGFGASLFSFFFMSKEHSIILWLAADEATRGTATVIMLYYHLLFMLPLTGAVLFIWWQVGKINERFKKREKFDITGGARADKKEAAGLFHLLVSLAMAALGAGILFFL